MVKINMCCGKRDFGYEWVHIDGGDFNHVHQRDVTRLDFKNNTVDVIYCSHGINYFDREEIVPILNEWKRALVPGGILRLAVPDFEVMAHLYMANHIVLEDMLGPLFGKWDLNGNKIYHKTTYDFESLSILLLKVGFKDVKPYDWRKTDHAEHDDHSSAYMFPKGDKEKGTLISLNVECVK